MDYFEGVAPTYMVVTQHAKPIKMRATAKAHAHAMTPVPASAISRSLKGHSIARGCMLDGEPRRQ